VFSLHTYKTSFTCSMGDISMEHGCVYLITNTVNGKKYVGQHNEPTPHRRFLEHKMRARNGGTGCPVLYDAIRKHGEESFTIETLWVGPRSEMNDKEVYYADLHKTYVHNDPPGYNVAHCGNQPGLGRIVSEEEKEAFSKRMKELPRTETHCRLIGEGVSAYISNNPEIMEERYKRTSQTLKERGPTGPQAIEAVQSKIEAQQKRTDNLPVSSGMRQIRKDGNVWCVDVKNRVHGVYHARFKTEEAAINARDTFKSSGLKTPTEFPKKTSECGSMIKKTKDGKKFAVDIHSKRFPSNYYRQWETLDEAIKDRDRVLKSFESDTS